jgi:hypothetical protein
MPFLVLPIGARKKLCPIMDKDQRTAVHFHLATICGRLFENLWDINQKKF